MNTEEERKRFERFLPVPYGVMWSVLNGEYIAREEDSISDADEYNEHFIIWLYAKRDALRPRDARVDQPEYGQNCLVWYSEIEERFPASATLTGWLDINQDFISCPLWLPMPPAPEEE